MLLLFFLLLFLTIIIYLINGKRILSPAFITCVTYTIGTAFACMGIKSWTNVTFNYLTILVMFSAIICMEFGEYIILAHNRQRYTVNVNVNEQRQDHLFKIPFGLQVIGLAISCLGCYLYYRRVLEIAYMYGYTGTSLLIFVRNGLENERTGYLVVILKNFSQAFSYVNIAIFFNNAIVLKKFNLYKRYFPYLLSIIPTAIIFYLSSSRYTFIKLICFVFFSFLILYTRKYKFILSVNKLLKLTLVFVCGIGLFYLIYAKMGESRASFVYVDVFDKFIMYAGSSIVALSEYISNGMQRSEMFGEETLYGIFTLIQRFFPSINTGTHFLEAIRLNDLLSTNVYTIIRSLIADYGFSGMLLIEVLIGSIYTHFNEKIKSKKVFTVAMIIYPYFMYELVFQLFSPLMLSDIGSITQIFEILWIIIIFKIYKKYAVKYKVDLRQQLVKTC